MKKNDNSLPPKGFVGKLLSKTVTNKVLIGRRCASFMI